MLKLVISFIAALLFYNAEAQSTDIIRKKLSLDDAVKIALENNPEIKKGKYNIESLKGKYYKDISLPMPELSAVYEFIPAGKNISEFEERTFEISQQFDFPYMYFLKSDKSNSEIEAVESDIDHTRNNIISSVKRSYYKVVADKIQLSISEENYNISNEFVRKAQIRYNVGECTNLELLTAKNQFSEAKANMEISRKEYSSSFYFLRNAMGKDSIESSNFDLTDSLGYSEYDLKPEELIAKGFGLNPLLKKASYNRKTAEINKTIGWSKLIPSFNIAYSNQTSKFLTNGYGFRIGMNFPLWFFMESRGEIQENNANFLAASYELTSVKNNISLNITNTFEDYMLCKNQFKLYKDELLPQSEEIYRIADVSYELGEITYLEYLQAKITYINTKSNYYKSLFQYNQSLINLEEAVGIQLF